MTPNSHEYLLRDVLEALKRAQGDIQGWGAYAAEYFKEKWDLDGDIEALNEPIARLAAFLDDVPDHNDEKYNELYDGYQHDCIELLTQTTKERSE